MFSWVHLGSLGFNRVHLDYLRFTQDHSGPIWVHFGFLWSTQGHLHSLWFTPVNLDSICFQLASLRCTSWSFRVFWVQLGTLVFTLDHSGSFWFTWVHFGFIWIHLDSHLFNWVDLSATWYTLVQSGSHGFTTLGSLVFTQVHSSSFVLTRVHLISLGFTLVHFGFNWVHGHSHGFTSSSFGGILFFYGLLCFILVHFWVTQVYFGFLRSTSESPAFTWDHLVSGDFGSTWFRLGALKCT